MKQTLTKAREGQVAGFMALYGPSVQWKPVLLTPNRQSAQAAEQAMVTAHVAQYREMPRAQKLPRPK